MGKPVWVVRQEVNQITDGLNKPVDKGIKTAVVGLRANGIVTLGSCQGHRDHGVGYPHVDVGTQTSRLMDSMVSTELSQENPDLIMVKTLSQIANAGRVRARKQVVPLIDAYNEGKPVTEQVTIIRQLAGCDVIKPLLAKEGNPSSDELKQQQDTMRKFGQFLIKRVSGR